ncbi:hypothetical protein [Streptomyces sp. NPDC048659]|uniref:hypothetical protein n=1 Tax=Streptomyces sp. NPDC048659 TaxID=3155489 RepID=UPI003445B8FB
MSTDSPTRSYPDGESVCRVCGYDDGSVFWEGGWPTQMICPCCANESDVADTSVRGVRNYRGWWAGKGAPWWQPKERPEGWDIFRQLARIPEEWR